MFQKDPELVAQLKEIREDFIQDGQRWTISEERKLLHLWKKYKRTQEHLKKSIDEVQTLKSQRKKEFDELEKYIQSIKDLSQSKDVHIKNLMEENTNLGKQVKQINIEREAYLKEHQAITDLLVTEGLTEFDGMKPQKQIEQLLKERNDWLAKIKEQEDVIEALQKDKQALEDSFVSREKNLMDEKGEVSTQMMKITQERDELLMQQEELRAILTAKEQTLQSTSKMYDESQVKMAKLKLELETEKLAHEESQLAKTAGKLVFRTRNDPFNNIII